MRAWDVDRLVALAKDLTPELVPLTAIVELDEPYWGDSITPRNVADHARLIAEADPTYPVILSSDGRIMDGMHRVLMALMRGETHVLAVRFTTDPHPDFEGVHADDLPYGEETDANDRRDV